jgi:hypothetical protein
MMIVDISPSWSKTYEIYFATWIVKKNENEGTLEATNLTITITMHLVLHKVI